MNASGPDPRCRTAFRIRVFLCTLVTLAIGLMADCGGGSTSAPPSKELAPSNLSYVQTVITATVGEAISVDAPTVTGTVTLYQVSPALPAGLSIDSSAGTISGTPTTETAKATYTVTASNSAGSTTASLQITVNLPAPSNLTYPHSSITATVGVAISPETPTVSGTVSSYSVNPALPAGINLSASDGSISGTPTVASAKTTFTVTAANSGGAATATIQITVNPNVPPPSSLVYPRTSFLAEAGQPMVTDIPRVSGIATSFSISPPLPAGLILDGTTGAIYGVPATSSVEDVYTVTAVGPGGSTSASLTLQVNAALTTLMDLGTVNQINALVAINSRVLVQDDRGHWTLVNYSTGDQLASGDQGSDVVVPGELNIWPVAMAGKTIAIGVANGVEVRSASDGQLISVLVSPMIDPLDSKSGNAWWKLSVDGSYVCAGSTFGLAAWTPSGAVLVSRSGDYSQAKVFAAPGEMRIAMGAAGANVIEDVSLSDGSSVTGPEFSGNFNGWFADGERFLSNLATNVWTYAKTSVEESFVTLPTVEGLAGANDWVWTYSANTVTVYPVGSSTPAAAYPVGTLGRAIPSGNTIALLPYGDPKLSVVDLSGATPAKTDYMIPTAYTSAFAAFSPADWIVGNRHGTVFDGATVGSAPRFLTQGTAFSIAGSTSNVAIAVANDTIYTFDPTVTTPLQTISFSSSLAALSADGSVLAAAANTSDAQYHPDRTLNVYSLPAATTTYSWPYQYPGGTNLFDFSLALSGSNIAQLTGTWTGAAWSYARQVTAVTGGSVLWSDTPTAEAPVRLSPDGTLVAAPSNVREPGVATTIYKNGAAVTAVEGFAVGWIDDNQLFVDNYGYKNGDPVYTGTTIYSAAGSVIASPSMPELKAFQTVSPGLIYTPDTNQIYSTSTGEAIWSSSYPYGNVGASAGGFVVFESGSRVVVQKY